MKFEDVKNLIQLIRDNEISEVEIEEPNLRIRIRRGLDNNNVGTVASTQHKSSIMKGELNKSAPVNVEIDQSTQTEKQESENYDEDRYKKVYAPLVGTFYRAPAPDSEPFVEVGDVIQKGAVICIIEAMKVMNEIESEHSGKIVAIPVENAAPVEYGEPICIIDPFVQ